MVGGVSTLEVVAGREARGRLKSLNPTMFLCARMTACVCARNRNLEEASKASQLQEKKKSTLTLQKCVTMIACFGELVGFLNTSREDGDTSLCVSISDLHLHLIKMQRNKTSEGLLNYTTAPPKIDREQV